MICRFPPLFMHPRLFFLLLLTFSDVNGDSLMDVIVGAFGSSYSVAGAAHVVYGTKSSAAYNASFLDLGAGGNGGLDGFDGFTVWGIEMEADIYATLVSEGGSERASAEGMMSIIVCFFPPLFFFLLSGNVCCSLLLSQDGKH